MISEIYKNRKPLKLTAIKKILLLAFLASSNTSFATYVVLDNITNKGISYDRAFGINTAQWGGYAFAVGQNSIEIKSVEFLPVTALSVSEGGSLDLAVYQLAENSTTPLPNQSPIFNEVFSATYNPIASVNYNKLTTFSPTNNWILNPGISYALAFRNGGAQHPSIAIVNPSMQPETLFLTYMNPVYFSSENWYNFSSGLPYLRVNADLVNNPAQVPEPSGYALVACGLFGLISARRRKTLIT